MHRLGDVDIRLLRVFKSVVECGGFSAAEVELNIGRSAISTHMADLEQRLGMRLCDRGRSGFALTEHGRKAYEQTLILLAALESFRTRMSACRDTLVGDLNLGVADSTLTDPGARLPQIVDSFRARGPEVYIGLQVASPNELERAVLDGRLHRRSCLSITACRASTTGRCTGNAPFSIAARPIRCSTLPRTGSIWTPWPATIS
ncbi:LysR family transcriptional regulator [Marinobacterium aestuariivivens]|uniref:LysR family transcriptional regulator n=1 Tax=Marinobacterium aestuariivivens TaxID=1698799 RepID=A0ABW1ZVN9_9GAMM